MNISTHNIVKHRVFYQFESGAPTSETVNPTNYTRQHMEALYMQALMTWWIEVSSLCGHACWRIYLQTGKLIKHWTTNKGGGSLECLGSRFLWLMLFEWKQTLTPIVSLLYHLKCMAAVGSYVSEKVYICKFIIMCTLQLMPVLLHTFCGLFFMGHYYISQDGMNIKCYIR